MNEIKNENHDGNYDDDYYWCLRAQRQLQLMKCLSYVKLVKTKKKNKLKAK